MRRRPIVTLLGILTLLIGGAFLLGIGSAWFGGHRSGKKSVSLQWGESREIGVVEVEGEIFTTREAIEQLDEFVEDDDIRAILLRINSPGGSVGASQEIYEKVKKVAGEKPVIASFGSIAASGGYYIACGATKILANPGTVTGSIGVRMEHVNVEDLLSWARLKHETLKAGKYKDIASPHRPLTEEERQMLNQLLADMHAQFKETVKTARGLSEADIETLAQGQLFTGQQALEHHLIDQLGGLTEAIGVAAEAAKIRGKPKLVYPPKYRYFVERFLSEGAWLRWQRALVSLFEIPFIGREWRYE